MVHGDQAPTDTVVIDPQSTWVASDKAAYNFRFLNWNRVAKESAFRKKPRSATDDDDFRYWYRQILSRYPHDLIPPELIELRNEVLSKYSVQICEYLFRDFEPLPVHRLEPRTLFMLS